MPLTKRHKSSHRPNLNALAQEAMIRRLERCFKRHYFDISPLEQGVDILSQEDEVDRQPLQVLELFNYVDFQDIPETTQQEMALLAVRLVGAPESPDAYRAGRLQTRLAEACGADVPMLSGVEGNRVQCMKLLRNSGRMSLKAARKMVHEIDDGERYALPAGITEAMAREVGFVVVYV